MSGPKDDVSQYQESGVADGHTNGHKYRIIVPLNQVSLFSDQCACLEIG